MERTTRDCSRVLNILLALSLCCLSDKVETNPVKEILSILDDEEFNIKTFRDHIPGMEACRAALEALVTSCKKRYM